MKGKAKKNLTNVLTFTPLRSNKLALFSNLLNIFVKLFRIQKIKLI